MNQVRQWLRVLDLEKYTLKFQEEAYDDIYMIKQLNEKQINKMIEAVGCRKNEAYKIRKNLSMSKKKQILTSTSSCDGIEKEKLNLPVVNFFLIISLWVFITYIHFFANTNEKMTQTLLVKDIIITPLKKNWRPSAKANFLDLTKRFQNVTGFTSIKEAVLLIKEMEKIPSSFYLFSSDKERYFKIDIKTKTPPEYIVGQRVRVRDSPSEEWRFGVVIEDGFVQVDDWDKSFHFAQIETLDVQDNTKVEHNNVIMVDEKIKIQEHKVTSTRKKADKKKEIDTKKKKTEKKKKNTLQQIKKSEIQSKSVPIPQTSFQHNTQQSLRIRHKGGIGIRKDPVYPGTRLGAIVRTNDVVAFSEKKIFNYNDHPITFYKLVGTNGWIHNYNPDVPSALDGVEELNIHETTKKKSQEKMNNEKAADKKKKSVKITYVAGVGVRKNPVYPGERIGPTKVYGSVVDYTEKKTFNHNDIIITFYKLKNEPGWIHNFNPDSPHALDGAEELDNNNKNGVVEFDNKNKKNLEKSAYQNKKWIKIQYQGGAGIRKKPEYPGERVDDNLVIASGEVVSYTKKEFFNYKGTSITFYKLEDGRGWIHDYNPNSNSHSEGIKELDQEDDDMVEVERIKIKYPGGISVRRDPTYPGVRVGITIEVGDVVTYSEKNIFSFNGNDITFYKLADNSGWIHNYNPQNPLVLDGVEEFKEIIPKKLLSTKSDNLSQSNDDLICHDMQKKHNVIIGESWGSAPSRDRKKWLALKCDQYF